MPTPPIIIIKKKGGHGGHHGGAWKVAYADFVTAMMALFIVLWLMNSGQKIQVAVGGYFKDPSGTAKKIGTGLAGTGENLQLAKQDMAKLKVELQNSIRSITDLDKLNKNIEMTVTAEGLRIELLESDKGTFFDSGSSGLNASGQELLAVLAVELGKVRNQFRSKDTLTQSLLRASAATATGNCQPTGRTRRGDGCSSRDCVPIRSRKCGALRINVCAT